MVFTIPIFFVQINLFSWQVYDRWYTNSMNEEIIHRLFQVVLYTGGIVSFWQITKHMPKVFHNLLEYIVVSTYPVFCVLPIAGVIEYILGGNIHQTMMFAGCICGVSLLCVLWMLLVSLSRSMQGKEQFKYVVL